MITRADIAAMSEAELATLARRTPKGFTPVIDSHGRFWFLADFESLPPSVRAALRVIGRLN